ncbi:MAG: 50S ribosomal protein L9 [Candidatus Dadabacteria bacterium]|nr:50S ribosomal protein L9 [Candidatus Dadabacteria bacterium]NIS08902.1 50S ribosomal protein L9 [Candidatus Dadabacteria bacterium]NIV43210.1 50S ribosomal protein L9 [Candidatus Dadabacteria bacterium]NIY21138.1 50S ribosomal protein L9 [Candidatus Dadabacteria bacterium]
MKVILTTDVESVGYMGEIKDVKRGLARNYLLPKNLAVEATPGNVKVWNQKQRIIEKHQIKRKEDAESLAGNLSSVTCTIKVKVGEEGKLFGSVTTQNISDDLALKGYKISKKDIVLDASIKETGTYDVPVKIHPEVSASIKVVVESEESDQVSESGDQSEVQVTEQAADSSEPESSPESSEEASADEDSSEQLETKEQES